jgi:hypothetical protein
MPKNKDGLVGDFGTGTIATSQRQHRSFRKARAFVRALGLHNRNEWFEYCQGRLKDKGNKPDDIPANPNVIYRNKGWISMGDWLGTGWVAPEFRIYRPFKEARTFVHRLKLKNIAEWKKYCKGELPRKGRKPDDIPSKPDGTYRNRDGIKGDWFGTGFVAVFLRKYRSFRKARKFAHGLNLKSQKEWFAYCKGKLPDKGYLPDDIPVAPHGSYKNKGWVSWGDWLGTGYIADQLKEYRPFYKARAFVHNLKLKSGAEWSKYCKGQLKGKGRKPEDIPNAPQHTYKDKGYISKGDWLGTGTVATRFRKYRPFKRARAFVRKLGLRSETEWRKYRKGELKGYAKKPEDIPSNPNRTYKIKGWVSWPDWVGKQK